MIGTGERPVLASCFICTSYLARPQPHLSIPVVWDSKSKKKKKKLIIRNNVHSYAQAHVHTRSYMHSHTRTHIQKHARTYCYTWFFLNLDYAQRDRRCRALHRCIVPPIHVFTDCYGEKKKEKRNNNKYSKAQTIRFNAFHYYILYV